MNLSLVVQVVDAVEKLERDAVPRGKAQLPVPCSDVVAQCGVAVLQAVPVVGLVVAVDLHDVGGSSAS